jgi:hypothetical protein
MSHSTIMVNVASTKPRLSCGWIFHPRLEHGERLINNTGEIINHLILDVVAELEVNMMWVRGVK